MKNRSIILIVAVLYLVIYISNKAPSTPLPSTHTATTTLEKPLKPVLSPEDRARIIGQATRGLKLQRDNMERTSFYSDKNHSRFITNFGAYVGISDGGTAWLRVRAMYYSKSWLFFTRIKIMADNEVVYEKETSRPVHDNRGGYVWETADFVAKDDDIEALRKIASSKKVTVRFAGRDHYDDHQMSVAELVSLKKILGTLDALKVL